MTTTSQTVRIVIADDHTIFRDGLRRLLEAEPDMSVVGEAADAEDAIRLAQSLRPDILLLDVAMPQMSGLDALEALANTTDPPRVILLTAAIDRADIVKALRLGARGVVLKDSATALLLKAMRVVVEGGYWMGRESVSDLVVALQSVQAPPDRADGSPFGLTQRELQVVELIVAAAGNRKIAETLMISEKTVKHHLTNIFEKLGVSSRLELAHFAMRHHLIPRD